MTNFLQICDRVSKSLKATVDYPFCDIIHKVCKKGTIILISIPGLSLTADRVIQVTYLETVHFVPVYMIHLLPEHGGEQSLCILYCDLCRFFIRFTFN